MDKLKDVGSKIFQQVGPTAAAYAPLLSANAGAIQQSISRRSTHTYGSAYRQELDYYPCANSSATTPVILYFYGGGLVSGSKIQTNPALPEGLVYANVAHFFNESGFDVAVVDYRLVVLEESMVPPPMRPMVPPMAYGDVSKSAKFPEASDDVRDAVRWVRKQFEGQRRQVFLLGASAGSLHSLTYAMLPRYEQDRKDAGVDGAEGSEPYLAGIVSLGAPWSFVVAPTAPEFVLKSYYGPEFKEQGLLEQLEALEGLETVPRVFAVKGEREADGIRETYDETRARWPGLAKTKGWHDGHMLFATAEGQNHISVGVSIGTGVAEEEAWGREVVEWMRRQ